MLQVLTLDGTSKNPLKHQSKAVRRCQFPITTTKINLKFNSVGYATNTNLAESPRIETYRVDMFCRVPG